MINTVSEMKTSLDEIKIRFYIAKEKISELEDIALEITQNEQNKKKHKKNCSKS